MKITAIGEILADMTQTHLDTNGILHFAANPGGAHGAMWRCGNLQGMVPGFSVKAVDTNGAGDAFFGAFLSRIAVHGGLDGLTKDEINQYIRFANKTASITTSRPGAIPAMPALQEVEEGLK